MSVFDRKESQLEIRRKLEVFSSILNSVMVLDIVALEKPSASAVLLTEAPAILATTVCHFLNSAESRILTEILVKPEK